MLIVDVGFLYRQATVGKLPFKVKFLPDFGGF